VPLTVPPELRGMLRPNQRRLRRMMKATAEAHVELGRVRRHVGGIAGCRRYRALGRSRTAATGIPPAASSWC
jgi:hypothetical protein